MCVCGVCITIVRDDSPGGEGGVQASQHPEHAEPAHMFTTLIHLQELGEVGVRYRDGAANSGKNHKMLQSSLINPSYLLSLAVIPLPDIPLPSYTTIIYVVSTEGGIFVLCCLHAVTSDLISEFTRITSLKCYHSEVMQFALSLKQ